MFDCSSIIGDNDFICKDNNGLEKLHDHSNLLEISKLDESYLCVEEKVCTKKAKSGANLK